MVKIVNKRIPVPDIVVGKRYRKEYTEIPELAESIKELGLLHPIVISPAFDLLAGGRRLEAVKLLGWENVDVRIAHTPDELTSLMIEHDENEHRVNLTASERVNQGRKILSLNPQWKEDAAARQKAGKRVEPSTPESQRSDTPSEVVESKVAEAVGLSRAQYGRARRVVEATEDPNPEVRAVAEQAQSDMDSGTLKITQAEQLVKAKRDEIAGRTTTMTQFATAKQAEKAMGSFIDHLDGLILALKKFEELHPATSKHIVTTFVNTLAESRRVHEATIKRLRKFIDE